MPATKALLDAYQEIPELKPKGAARPPRVAACFCDKPLVPENDGFIGKDFEGEITLQVKAPEGIHGVTVSRHDRFASLKGFRAESDGKKYEQLVLIRESESGFRYTSPKDNSLRLVKISKDGWFEAWQAGVVIQRGLFWLVIKPAYKERVCKNKRANGKLQLRVCSWKVDDLFRNILDDTSQIPVGSWDPSRRYNRNVQTDDLGKNEARVDYFSPFSGTGVLVSSERKKLKVHWSDIRKRSGTERQFLLSDEKVTFAGTKPAGNKSSLRRKAFGIQVVERKDAYQEVSASVGF